MDFVYGLFIPLLLLVMPWVAVRFVFVTAASRRLGYKQSLVYLAPAAALWAMGFALPEFWIAGGATDTFGLHTIGGVVAAILFWYVARAYRLRFPLWWQEPLCLYLFVSGLGVLNELFEFTMFRAGFLADKGGDTWWDLTANTLGALLAFAAMLVLRRISR